MAGDGQWGRWRRRSGPAGPWVLRHSLLVVLLGGVAALACFVAAYSFGTRRGFSDRFEVGLKAATGIAAVTAGLLTWGRLELSRQEHLMTADRDLMDRLGRTVDQLNGSSTLARTAGVFAIERFALDAVALDGDRRDVDWRMALDILAAFVREHSAEARHTASGSEPPAPVEVIEAVRVLGRFTARTGRATTLPYDFTGVFLRGADVSGLDLRGVGLSDANLRRASLRNSNLANSDLSRADLRDTDLMWVDLTGADLSYARLAGADLRGADLRSADLTGTGLTRADCSGADFRDARLALANLTEARLIGARLSLQQVRSAARLWGADYSRAFLYSEDFVELVNPPATTTGEFGTHSAPAQAPTTIPRSGPYSPTVWTSD